jgi:hypothetical protein
MSKKRFIAQTVIGLVVIIGASASIYFMHSGSKPTAPVLEMSESSPITTWSAPTTTTTRPHPYISPDGKWFMRTLTIGRSQYSRVAHYYLELVNLEGGPNQLIYLDYSFLPGQSDTQPEPLGWTPAGHWYLVLSNGAVVREGFFGGKNSVDPFNGNWRNSEVGGSLDFQVERNRGLWYNKLKGEETAQLIQFNLDENSFDESRDVVNVPLASGARITSGMMYPQTKFIPFIVRSGDDQDTLHVYDEASGTIITAAQPPVEKLMPKQLTLPREMVGPYRMELERTAHESNGIIVKITGVNNESSLFSYTVDKPGAWKPGWKFFW